MIVSKFNKNLIVNIHTHFSGTEYEYDEFSAYIPEKWNPINGYISDNTLILSIYLSHDVCKIIYIPIDSKNQKVHVVHVYTKDKEYYNYILCDNVKIAMALYNLDKYDRLDYIIYKDSGIEVIDAAMININ